MAQQDAVDLAQQTLAHDLGCAANDVVVLDAEAVEWPDSALGCPQPGKMYMQMITSGYRVLLEYDGQRYQVHTDNGRRAVRCDRANPLGRFGRAKH